MIIYTCAYIIIHMNLYIMIYINIHMCKMVYVCIFT